MNGPVRKSYHHTRIMWDGGVISDAARFCHEFGANPDVEELKRYNVAANARECDHAKLHWYDDGERAFYSCGGCDLSDPNWKDKFEGCRACSWSRNPKCGRCGGTGLIRRATPAQDHPSTEEREI